ncbi:uncharacterized protein M421DRAFT_8291 [Didymella exigua CBS 183.55]|uniref:SnoaL-like domain-containing protein n=1 Tax=Didymella exigua CBS 183.55 TaxID=1150837 RepID=A0A6A5RCL8_9PLEO|nr:uncharacterized protein M421DRAFT_8291 [Didymella exigua CBS 183.55]KAF1925030.1 hypothetical protein M421DRAFT_8291 [Didymella exigua CBS 183.55]
MSFSTKPAFVHYGTWDDETRSHPAMKWMEHYTNQFDAKAVDDVKNNLLTHDHVLVRTTGQMDAGAQASVDALYKVLYAPFAKWAHIPQHVICYAVEDGWEMMGHATLYWTLAVPGKQESGANVRDQEGNEWDGANPAAFNFRYRMEGGEIRMCRMEIAADPSTVIVSMLKRGMMKAEDLMK